MKTNHVAHKGHRKLIVCGILSALLAISVALILGYSKLREIWLEQCVITDMSQQVTITCGKMVKADVLADVLGLRKGKNLALIDFDAKRSEALNKIPNLRDIRIVRSLPDKVSVYAEEREPIARISYKGRRTETGKVADVEGKVFLCQRGTRMLPVIRKGSAPGTAVGKTLPPRGLAALSVIRTCREPGFSDLSVLEIDTSKTDYLTLTLGGSYSTVKLAWEEMDVQTPSSSANLIDQLTNLTKAMRSRVGEGAIIWNATDTSKPGRIYADTKGNLK